MRRYFYTENSNNFRKLLYKKLNENVNKPNWDNLYYNEQADVAKEWLQQNYKIKKTASIFFYWGDKTCIYYCENIIEKDVLENTTAEFIRYIKGKYEIKRAAKNVFYNLLFGSSPYFIFDPNEMEVICTGFENNEILGEQIKQNGLMLIDICDERMSHQIKNFVYRYYYKIIKKYCNNLPQNFSIDDVIYTEESFKKFKSFRYDNNESNIHLSDQRKPNTVYSVQYVCDRTDGMPLSYGIDAVFYSLKDAYDYIISNQDEYIKDPIFNCVTNEVYTYNEDDDAYYVDDSYGTDWNEEDINTNSYIIVENIIDGGITGNKVWVVSAFIDYCDGDQVAYMFHFFNSKKLAEKAMENFINEEMENYDEDEIDDEIIEEIEERYETNEYSIQ